MEWEKTFETRDARFFDFNSIHPNIVSRVRDPVGAWNYCGKEEHILDHGDAPCPRPMKRKAMLDAFDAESKDEFLELVKMIDPTRYIFQHQNLEYYANKRYAMAVPTYTPDPKQSFSLPKEIEDWLEQRSEVLSYTPAPPAPTSVGELITQTLPPLTIIIVRQAQITHPGWTYKNWKNPMGKITGTTYLLERSLRHGLPR